MIFNFNNLIYLLFLHLLFIGPFIHLYKYLLNVLLNVPLVVGLVGRPVKQGFKDATRPLFMGLISLVLFLLYLKFTIYYF